MYITLFLFFLFFCMFILVITDVVTITIKKVYLLLSIFYILLSTLFSPIFFHYVYGPILGLIITFIYILTSLIFTVILITPIIKKETTTFFHKIGTLYSILVGTFLFFYGNELIELIDWKYRKNERIAIVEKILNDNIKEEVYKSDLFPPISNGGNEIIINQKENGAKEIIFFIDRGLLNHYSAYIYSSNSPEKSSYKTFKIMSKNWYKITK